MPTYFTHDPDQATVSDVKRWLRVTAPKGAICPCCKQHVKIYRRVLGSQMARWLIWLVRTWETLLPERGIHPRPAAQLHDRLSPEGPDHRDWWIDIKQSPVRGGDYAKLVHWGLIEQKETELPRKHRTDGARPKDSGLWRPTCKGIDFVHRRIAVPSHVVLYKNQLLGVGEDPIRIHQALGKKFDYEQLMRAPVNVEVPV